MASSSAQDVVNSSQSVDDHSSIDTNANNSILASAENGAYSSAPSNTAQLLQLEQDDLSSKQQFPSSSDQIYEPSQMITNGDNPSAQTILTNGEAHNAHDPHLEPGVGSDTDTSRADSTEQTRDLADKALKGGALKKTTTFKSVSVTKNFLAKTAPVTAATKTGDKSSAAQAISAPSPIAKPRLIAKSGSGLSTTPRPRSGADGASDGATVWNKNRPAPPAPPKQFTDEELKQQYGIHLASRIQSTDETGKVSRWADLEDDEDDWAPETVEWMDGTKSTIVAEATPEPAKAVPRPEVARPVLVKPMLALKRPSQVGPPKTILRPGAAQQAKPADAAAGGSPQSGPSSAVTTQAPAPSKSPWAKLPPVESAVPVFSPPPPPQPQQPSRFGHQNAHGFEALPPLPTHEIEADTFDRSWRESERGPRELFNSQSGRYEPAPENRRSSMRQENVIRGPSLLQRASQQDVTSPAEPSSAFQTRSGSDASPWSRRRGSSVSGTSAVGFERRMSTTKPPELPPQPEARTGIVIGHDIGPQAAKAESPQAQRAQQQATDRAEELATQRRVMLEKREAAIRRKKEEEESENAAKMERIRKKMESLGMAPLEPKAVEAAASLSPGTSLQEISITTNTKKTTTDITDATGNNVASTTTEKPLGAPQASATVILDNRLDVQATPGKAAETHAQPLQSVQSDPGLQARPQTTASHMTLAPGTERQTQTLQKQPSPRAVSQKLNASQGLPPSSFSSPGEHATQPSFKSPVLGADSFATWGKNSHAPQGGNVWGPPSSSRGIGNGAFGTKYSRFAHELNQQQNNMLPPTDTFTQPDLRPTVSQMRQGDTSPMAHQALLSDQNLAALGLTDDTAGERLIPTGITDQPPVNLPRSQQLSPIAPPQRSIQRSQPATHTMQPNKWQSFAQQDPSERARLAQEAAPRTVDSHEAMSGPAHRWTTNFKQTKVNDNWVAGGRETASTQSFTTEKNWSSRVPSALPEVVSPAPPISQTQNSVPPPASVEASMPGRESTVRLPNGPSSFAAGKPVRTPTKVAPSHHLGAHQSRFFPSTTPGSSPPPEESDHPVYFSNTKRPKVCLPSPKPQVRLPPASPVLQTSQLQSSPVIMPSRIPGSRVGVQPLVQSSDWQARFNGLFGRVSTMTTTPPSPPKTPPKAPTPALAVLPLTRMEIVHQQEQTVTTVSLPRRALTAVEENPTTKASVDDIFDGELSFGSTPKVSVPRTEYREIFTSGRNLLRLRPNAKYDRPIDPLSKHYVPLLDSYSRLSAVTVHLPLSSLPAKDVALRGSRGSARKPSAVKFGKTRAGTGSGENTPSPASTPMPKRFNNNNRSVSEQPPSSNMMAGSGSPQIGGGEGATTPSRGGRAARKPFKARKVSARV